MLKNKCCLYVIIPSHIFSITIYNFLIEFPSYLISYWKHNADTPLENY